ncbi:hypothetical protein HDU91_000836, partial [Kappamyces sp. JEL0680]
MQLHQKKGILKLLPVSEARVDGSLLYKELKLLSEGALDVGALDTFNIPGVRYQKTALLDVLPVLPMASVPYPILHPHPPVLSSLGAAAASKRPAHKGAAADLPPTPVSRLKMPASYRNSAKKKSGFDLGFQVAKAFPSYWTKRLDKENEDSATASKGITSLLNKMNERNRYTPYQRFVGSGKKTK